jgi:hypothetical protein
MGLNKIGAVEVPVNISFEGSEMRYIPQHSEASDMAIYQDYYLMLKEV